MVVSSVVVMFEVLDGLDGRGLADALDANHRAGLGRRAFELLMVAGWADVHNEDSVPTDGDGRVLPGMERAKAYGGDGTPLVAEFATVELAPLLGCSPVAADNLLRDGLDLRHRHPRLWARIVETARLAVLPGPALSGCRLVQVDPGTGEAVDLVGRLGLEAIVPVAVWAARRIAQVCHAAGLSLEQARWVDEVTSPLLGRLPWARFEKNLGAAIIEVDPGAAAARAKADALRQHVTLGRSTEQGLITMIIAAQAGDMVTAKAFIDRLAEILGLEGDTDPVNLRQARAASVLLGNPYHACALLLKHTITDEPSAHHDQPGDDTAGDAPGSDGPDEWRSRRPAEQDRRGAGHGRGAGQCPGRGAGRRGHGGPPPPTDPTGPRRGPQPLRRPGRPRRPEQARRPGQAR